MIDFTPLHLPVLRVTLISYFLIDNPPTDPMARDTCNDTPLHVAAQRDNLSVVKYFTHELKYDPNIRGQNYRTPLHCATIQSHIKIVKTMI